jgi:hypothetical protein
MNDGNDDEARENDERKDNEKFVEIGSKKTFHFFLSALA